MSISSITVTMAILHQDGKFLLQLRDDYPDILYPGHWGFFGGHIEEGETLIQGLKRELWEEITYQPPSVSLFRSYIDINRKAYIYSAPLTVSLDTLVQHEGQDMALVSPESIQKGFVYSQKIQEVRPIGDLHRQVLLDFIDSNLINA